MTTSKDLTNKASDIANIYADLQDEILKQIIKRLNTKDLANMSQDDVLKWQIQKLNELGNANGDTIQAILKAVKMSTTGLTDLLNMISDTAVQNADTGLKTATGLPTQPTNHVDTVMKAYQKQTLGDINNHINQSLISKSFKDTAQAQAYTDIINKTTAKVVTGLKSPQQALADTVYQWQSQGGLKSGFVDKGGHHWTMQGYANTVIQSTVPRTYAAVTKQRMDDYDYHLVLYPSHLASREACAPIQGHVLNLIPESDPKFNPNYDTVYNHGYGTASGTLGVNCSHWNYSIFVPGVSKNNQHPIDPDKAIENAKVQGDQRRMERAIRQSKSQLQAAEELGDEKGIKHFKLQIRSQQSAVRQLVKKHDFLARDYSREKFIGKPLVKTKHIVKPVIRSEKISTKAVNQISETNMQSSVGKKNYNKFIEHLKTVKDPQLNEIFAKYGHRLEFGNIKNKRASAMGRVIQLSQDNFDGISYLKPMKAVYHEIGHAFDFIGLKALTGKSAFETGKTVTKKVGPSKIQLKEYAKQLSTLDKYHFKDDIKSDLWKAMNGDAEQLGPKPRKMAEKEQWIKANKIIKENRNKFLKEYQEKAKANKDKYEGLSDMMESTGFFDKDYPLGFGHGHKYWEKTGTVESEFIAHMTESIATDDSELKVIEKIFPNSVKSYRNMLDDMLKG